MHAHSTHHMDVLSGGGAALISGFESVGKNFPCIARESCCVDMLQGRDVRGAKRGPGAALLAAVARGEGLIS